MSKEKQILQMLQDGYSQRHIVLSGELNDALSGRLFYADFRFPQGYQSL